MFGSAPRRIVVRRFTAVWILSGMLALQAAALADRLASRESSHCTCCKGVCHCGHRAERGGGPALFGIPQCAEKCRSHTATLRLQVPSVTIERAAVIYYANVPESRTWDATPVRPRLTEWSNPLHQRPPPLSA